MYTQAEVEQLMEQTREAERERIADVLEVESDSTHSVFHWAKLRDVARRLRENAL